MHLCLAQSACQVPSLPDGYPHTNQVIYKWDPVKNHEKLWKQENLTQFINKQLLVKSVFKIKLIIVSVSGAFTANSPRQLNILGHDGNPLGMNGAQIRVFEEANHVSLARLLNRENRLRLEPQI